VERVLVPNPYEHELKFDFGIVSVPECPVCQTETGADFNFCPNCRARMVPQPPSSNVPHLRDLSTSLGDEPHGSSRKIIVATVAIVILLLLISLFTLVIPSRISQVTTMATPLSCPPNPSSVTTVAEPSPNYDVQEVEAFGESYSQLAFNVTAVEQCDSNGYGPTYILNGLSNTGYWYQVGISWNWPLQAGGYTSGFGFASEAWAPGGVTHAPSPVAFTGTVNSGDTVELSLSLSGDQVIASARDLNTSATGSTSFPAHRGSEFVGSQAQQSRARFSFATQGYFTGLMIEWYHVEANFDGDLQQKVIFSESATPIVSGTLGVGEWNFSTTNPTSVFSDTVNNGNPINFGASPDQLQQFVINGYTLSADRYEFVIG
jgi:hypothetical protein